MGTLSNVNKLNEILKDTDLTVYWERQENLFYLLCEGDEIYHSNKLEDIVIFLLVEVCL